MYCDIAILVIAACSNFYIMSQKNDRRKLAENDPVAFKLLLGLIVIINLAMVFEIRYMLTSGVKWAVLSTKPSNVKVIKTRVRKIK